MAEGGGRKVNGLDEVPGCEQASTHKGAESAARQARRFFTIATSEAT